ncbi:hypothetical protein [Metabacillus litoralis]|uniref:hypothetical protein n=1 Tax=Metabacillus litoralis TaxID=152268 RepID=UPI001CFD1166|nr:hypothetical protein [Metabacillus litoralis]
MKIDELIRTIDEEYFEEQKLSILVKLQVPEEIVNALYKKNNQLTSICKEVVNILEDIDFAEWDEFKIKAISHLITEYNEDDIEVNFSQWDLIEFLESVFFFDILTHKEYQLESISYFKRGLAKYFNEHDISGTHEEIYEEHYEDFISAVYSEIEKEYIVDISFTPNPTDGDYDEQILEFIDYYDQLDYMKVYKDFVVDCSEIYL